MLYLLLAYLLWTFPVLGWGSVLLHWVHPSYEGHWGERGLVGLCVLGTVGCLIHFFIPISPVVSTVIWLLGWILFWRSRRACSNRGWQYSMVWILFVAAYSAGVYQVFDTRRYYFPTLMWHWTEVLPLGLGNLNEYYALNSIWMMVASTIRLPFFDERVAYAANGLAAIFAGQAIFQRALASGGRVLGLSLLLGLFLLVDSYLLPGSGTIAADISGAWMTLFGLLLWVEKWEKPDSVSLPLLLFVSLFSFMIKPSQLPIFLLALYVIVYEKRWFSKEVAVASFALGIWLLRGLLLSGCLVFPAEKSCIEAIPWSVPLSQVATLRRDIFLYNLGRGETGEPFTALQWIYVFAKSRNGLVFFGSSLLGVVSILAGRRRLKRVEWITLGVLMGAIAYGILNAPAERFSYAFFAFLAAYLLTLAYEKVRVDWLGRALTGLLIILALFRVARNSMDASFRPLTPEPIPRVALESRMTRTGVEVKVPPMQDCWVASPLCSDQFNPDLRAWRLADRRWIFMVK